ncbi:MAG: 3-keto-disaccharide hydrolase, partial [Phycisphaeraceae bacterium]
MIRVLALLVLCVFTGCHASQELLAVDTHPDSSGWQPLFAADLSDASYPAGVWTVEDGELTASADKAIWTTRDYDDFVLDLEFKVGPNANSGVIVYSTDTANWIPGAIEVQILDDGGEKW